MLTYPNIDPVALQLGPLKIHWYGLMYLVAFAQAWWLGVRRAKASDGRWRPEEIGDIISYGAFGVVLGGRIGYMLFYYYPINGFFSDPLAILRVWDGGMSFHGGLLGVLLALALYGKKTQRGFFEMTDFIAPVVPLGLAAGRIGNFINGELWGRASTAPWAMVFPQADALPRHPSQLYEFALEGVVLFGILWWYSSKPRPRMAVSGLFLIGYACARITVEFFREPDQQLGYILLNTFTMGQLLSLPLFVLGIILFYLAYKTHAKT